MQGKWLHRSGKSECIVFFSGWGMDPHPFSGIESMDYDVYMVYDYQKIDPFSFSRFGSYQRLYLVAWSMGVYVGSFLLNTDRGRFAGTVAVNGTLSPLDDRLGIPVDAYNEMRDELTAKSVVRFYQDMFSEKGGAKRFLAQAPERPLDSLQRELVALQELYLCNGRGQDFFWKKYVSRRDSVFSARNQFRAWGRDDCLVIRTGHFPFYLQPWDSWIKDVVGRG